jgi:CheY-like chemotaxis protein
MLMASQGLKTGVSESALGSRRRVLLIEDNAADAQLTKMVHDDMNQCSWLDIVSHGKQAMEYLRGEGMYSEPTRPDIILMDVTLPAKSGIEMIAEIRAVLGCELTPIVIVSGSENPVTVQQAYKMGANCVIKKPATLDEYFQKIGTCYEFWCGVAELPYPTDCTS